jgi:hypothetical protein
MYTAHSVQYTGKSPCWIPVKSLFKAFLALQEEDPGISELEVEAALVAGSVKVMMDIKAESREEAAQKAVSSVLLAVRSSGQHGFWKFTDIRHDGSRSVFVINHDDHSAGYVPVPAVGVLLWH